MSKKDKRALDEGFQKAEQYFRHMPDEYMPGVSVNIVVFNYCNDKLKVLVMRLAETGYYMLPGGYVMNNENLDDAAARIFNEWTDIREYQLEQFYTSGKVDRTSDHLIREILSDARHISITSWFDQRKISVCYLALLNEPSINASKIDFLVSEHKWVGISRIPHLLFDHNHIISKAIQRLQDNLDQILIKNPLFKKEFTMNELQKLYEAVYQKSFTRTNFQRRMLGLDILVRTGKQYTGKAHKAPYLYSFRKTRS